MSRAAFIEPCLPSPADHPPSGDAWLHEIKHDGFRIIARKDGERVRLYSRAGQRPDRPFSADRRGARSSARALVHHRRRGRGLAPPSTTLARRVPPLSQGPFNAQNFSEPLIISEPEISF